MKLSLSFVPSFVLKFARSFLGYTQATMAAELSMKLSHYKAIEKNRCSFPIAFREALDRVLEPLEPSNSIPSSMGFLKYSRKCLHLSIRQMAKFIGVAASTWQAWEVGKSTPRNKRILLKKLIPYVQPYLIILESTE